MENRQQRTIQMFERVLEYLKRDPVEPEPPLLASMKDSLRTTIARLYELQREQHSATIGTEERAVTNLRQRMRRQTLMPLVRIAKPLLAFAPGTEQVLRVPHARADTATVAACALEVAKVLEPHADFLASAGFGDEFIAELTARAEYLAAASARADEARQRRARATLAIREQIAEGMRTVTVIEGIVMAHGPRRKLSFWREMRRVQARLGRPRERGKRPSASPPL